MKLPKPRRPSPEDQNLNAFRQLKGKIMEHSAKRDGMRGLTILQLDISKGSYVLGFTPQKDLDAAHLADLGVGEETARGILERVWVYDPSREDALLVTHIDKGGMQVNTFFTFGLE